MIEIVAQNNSANDLTKVSTVTIPLSKAPQHPAAKDDAE